MIAKARSLKRVNRNKASKVVEPCKQDVRNLGVTSSKPSPRKQKSHKQKPCDTSLSKKYQQETCKTSSSAGQAQGCRDLRVSGDVMVKSHLSSSPLTSQLSSPPLTAHLSSAAMCCGSPREIQWNLVRSPDLTQTSTELQASQTLQIAASLQGDQGEGGGESGTKREHEPTFPFHLWTSGVTQPTNIKKKPRNNKVALALKMERLESVLLLAEQREHDLSGSQLVSGSSTVEPCSTQPAPTEMAVTGGADPPIRPAPAPSSDVITSQVTLEQSLAMINTQKGLLLLSPQPTSCDTPPHTSPCPSSTSTCAPAFTSPSLVSTSTPFLQAGHSRPSLPDITPVKARVPPPPSLDQVTPVRRKSHGGRNLCSNKTFKKPHTKDTSLTDDILLALADHDESFEKLVSQTVPSSSAVTSAVTRAITTAAVTTEVTTTLTQGVTTGTTSAVTSAEIGVVADDSFENPELLKMLAKIESDALSQLQPREITSNKNEKPKPLCSAEEIERKKKAALARRKGHVK